MNEQDTTAVLTPIQGQVEEIETNSQPVPALSAQGHSSGQAKPADRKSVV